jgi:glycosyltransferase involved in cell wall biosynthesis
MISSFIVGLSVKNVDLVWGTTPPIFQSATAWLLARVKRVPFLLEVRDLWPAFAIAVGVLKNKILINASLWLEAFLYQHADCVMVNSPGFINHVTERGAKSVHLVPNGVDPAMFFPDDSGKLIRQHYNLAEKFVVLYAGAFGLSNDLGIILEAAHDLKSNSNIHFLMVGDGKEKANLQKHAFELALNNITFCPPMPKSEIQDYFAASDLCIAILKPIELYKTTYPNKVFDYMAAGRPVLLAIDGVIRKVVEDGQAGIVIPPGDPQAMATAILNASKTPGQSRQMGCNGRQYVQKYFNRNDTAVQLENLILKLRRSNG